MRRLVLLYGFIRQLLQLPRLVPVKWYFDEQTVWMVYDSHNQVFVTGSICFSEETVKQKIKALNLAETA